MDTGDTAWLLMSTALVMIMLPGLALFYGGLVRRKNVLSTIMHSFFGLALVSVVWVIVGFSLAFGPDVNLPILGTGWIGGLDFAMFNGVGLAPSDDVRHDRAVRPVRGVPADVRGHHAGAHHRRLRRAQAVQRLRPVHGPLVDPRLLAARPLGVVGRRLAVQARRPRLRRRHRRPHLVRRLRPDRRPAHRPPRRQRRGHGAARRADDRPRRRPAVVRLVRLQRRLRCERRWPRRQRIHRHQHGRRGRDHHLGPRELSPQGQGQRRRRGRRCGRRPRRDHARRRAS